jgi:hypothetical protein
MFSEEKGRPAMTAAPLDMVRQVVAGERRRGAKIDTAFEIAAATFNVSARWVRAVIRGEPAVIKPCQAAPIAERFLAWLARDIAHHETLIAERRALLLALESQNGSDYPAHGRGYLARNENPVRGRGLATAAGHSSG